MKYFVNVMTFFTFVFIGCASSPKMQPIPTFDIKKGSKIGVINFVGTEMKHYHIGTTVFNNFEKEYEVGWDIPGFINDELKRQTSKIGYETVIIKADEKLKLELKNRTVKENNQFVLSPSVKPIVEKLAEEYGIDMLYIFEPFKSSIFVPNITINVENYGAATRSFLGVGSTQAFAMINATSICLKPVALTRGGGCANKKEISGLAMIGNFANLNEKELSEIEKGIKDIIREMIPNLLTNSNLQKQVDIVN